MYLIDIIPLTRIPHTQPQVLSYFHGAPLKRGALVQIPLGRRQEEGIVIGARDLAGHKMEIKSADFELRNISKIISLEPVLTAQQLELALFLGQYYFCSPGIFAKMSLPPKNTLFRHPERSEGSRANARPRPQKLILAPTVSQIYSLYKSYSSKNTVLWRSELTRKQKNEAWQKVKLGEARTIIGTRSTVFLPFANLKEIIIEDAASPNHKSWDMFPRYDSRLAAKKLTEIFKCKITFKDFCHPERSEGSPTNVGPHSREIPRRYASRNDNSIAPIIIDMRQELKDGNFSIFSIPLYDAVKKALADKKQVILFINRRGAANFILCRDCGCVAKCPNCDAPLAYHLINNRPSLLCHHCGAKDTPPGRCPKCHSPKIKTVGSGSQKVETETHNFFPNAKIARLDSDNAPKPKDQQKIIAAFTERQTDILIATPMIFSWVMELTAAPPVVVGILSADTLLHIPDFRSGERTWQMITTLQNLMTPSFLKEGGGGFKSPSIPLCKEGGYQVFIVQTYNPDNSVLKYVKNGDYAGFAKEDLATRQALNYPPFSQIVKLTFRHRDAKRAGQEAKILVAKLNNILSTCHPELVSGSMNKRSRNEFGMTNNKPTDKIEISPALPAFLPRERGKYVWNIIIKFSLPHNVILNEAKNLSEFLQRRNSLLQYIPPNWEIDVDPENLL